MPMLVRFSSTRGFVARRLVLRLAVAALAAFGLMSVAAGVGAASTARSSANAPVNMVAPTVTGSPRQGQTLTGSTGSWSGELPIGYTFAWQRCSGSGGGCRHIPGATAQTYVVGSSDVGGTLRIVVVAKNAVGSASAASSPTGTVVAVATLPTVARQPDLHGKALVGRKVTVNRGRWDGTTPIAFTYQWQRCTTAGSCTDISGATRSSYVPVSSDVGYRLRATVTARNVVGSASATSRVTAAVVTAAGTAPSVHELPDLHGKAQVGETVTVDNGRWDGTTPITYSYRWQRCTTSGTCTDISRATKSSYVPAGADVGYRLRATVTATNSAGSASAASSPTGTVVAAASLPSAYRQPDVHGKAQVGQTVTVDNGRWYGTTPIAFTYQWQRCTTAGSCTDVSGATRSSYVPVSGDVGYRLRATVTARNVVGSASATSTLTAAVVAAAGTAPSVHAQPGLHGRAQVGQTVTVDNGRWDGTTPITFGYQWQRCTTAGTCTDISGATRSSYVPVASDVGYRLRATVTATNSAGSASAASSPTGTVVAAASPPSAYRQPDVHGRAQVGQTVSVDDGRWYGTSPIAFTYQWQRCSKGGACTGIGGATRSAYVPVSGDVGYRLRATVTARNVVGSASIASNLTATVVATGSAPTAHRQPDVHGSAQVGQTVTVDNGSWYGTTPITFGYQWQRCTTSGTCSEISGATKSSYVPAGTDVGYRLRAIVTAKNSVGSDSVASNLTAAVVAAPSAPANTSRPTVSAPSATVGSTVTGAIGSWGGTQPISYSFNWNRCDSAGNHCQTIANASAQTYMPHLRRRRLDRRVRRHRLELGRIVGRRLRADASGDQPAGRRDPAGQRQGVDPGQQRVAPRHSRRRCRSLLPLPAPLAPRVHRPLPHHRQTRLPRPRRTRARGWSPLWLDHPHTRGHNRNQRLRRHHLPPNQIPAPPQRQHARPLRTGAQTWRQRPRRRHRPPTHPGGPGPTTALKPRVTGCSRLRSRSPNPSLNSLPAPEHQRGLTPSAARHGVSTVALVHCV